MQLHHDMLVKLPTGTWRVDALGRWYPDIRGGDGPDDDDGDDDGDDADTGKPPEKTYTQRDLNRIAKREKEQGRKAALQQVADDLGMTVEEAKTFMEEANARSGKDTEDASKAKTRAAEKEKKAAALLVEAIEIRNSARVAAKLTAAGLAPKLAERLASTVDIDLTDDDLDDDDIADAIDELREDTPALFPSTNGTADDDDEPGTPRPPKDSTPRGKRRPPAKGTDLKARGRAKLLELHGHEMPDKIPSSTH